MEAPKGFNVRVYGILIDKDSGILVSEELIRGRNYTKLPGGGLQYGEGTRDCLRREFKEEMDWNIDVLDHFYTTDFFQESAFREHDQIVSIYYNIRPKHYPRLPGIHIDTPGEFAPGSPHASRETFRFVPMSKFTVELMSFPIDKVVAEMIIHRLS